MKNITLVTIAATALALGACGDRAEDLQENVESIGNQITEDPDIKEARQAIGNVIGDEGEGLKAVTEEARKARESRPEEQNTDESQGER